MYAVKGGHRGTMEELMQYEFLRYDIENKVLVHPVTVS